MKKIILLLAIFLSPVLMFAQTQTQSEPVYTKAEIMPEFPGGEGDLMKFISANVKYPEEARTSGKEGTVYLSFVISKDGKVTDAKIIRGVDKSLDDEAMRVLNMMPAWKPGMQSGQPVNVQYSLPVRFNLAAPEEKKDSNK